MNNQIELEEIKHIEVEILTEIDRLCKKHDLTYFLAYGTLLGAVRHKGFIPWDDDIDIIMPIDDYTKLLNLFDDECDDKYIMHSRFSDKNYWLSFAKVRRIDTLFNENTILNIKSHKGIFVDIFPMYNMSIDEECIEKKVLLSSRLAGAVMHKAKVNISMGKVSKILSYLPISISKMNRKIDKIFIHEKTGKYIAPMDINAANYRSSIYTDSDIYPIKEIEFEGKMFNAPNSMIDILTRNYGNYMKLPPESEQVSCHGCKNICYLTSEEVEDIKKIVERG